MSKKDHTKYSENKENLEPVVEEVIEETVEEIVEPVVEEVVEEVVEPAVEEVVEPVVEETEPTVEPVVEETEQAVELIEGVVNATKLNVRQEASKTSNAIYILEKGASVMIDPAESTEDFFKIKTIDIEGYCVKEFITIK